MHFLSLQNLRTKGVREKVLARATEVHGFSLERSWNVVPHMMAVNAGASLLRERKTRPLFAPHRVEHRFDFAFDESVIVFLNDYHLMMEQFLEISIVRQA
ncbi:hypothetical protein [Acidisoma sp. S159]|uniref:hypothetical protein n=1 Tax=Acidisoma sp. S159 TaxID=1747225 RepID=UPI00131AEE7C|nr:hypothetical protein [Acidisoma sp. S159]